MTVRQAVGRLAAGALLCGLLGAAAVADDFVPDDMTNSAPYVPTTQVVVESMLRLAGAKPGDIIYDLGSGDGRIPITAVRSFGAVKGVGIELNADLIRRSRENAARAGVADKVQFMQGDIFKLDFSEASIVTMYLLPDVNVALRPRLLKDLRPGTRIVTNLFDLGDWEHDRRIDVADPDPEKYNLTIDGVTPLYLFTVPAQAGGAWRIVADEKEIRVDLRQTYQKLAGTVRIDGRDAPIVEGALNGTAIAFTADGGAGPVRFEGRVTGNGILQGTLTVDGRSVAAAGTRDR